MSKSRRELPAHQPSQDDELATQIRGLFAGHPDASRRGQEVEQLTSALIRRFSAAAEVTSRTDLRSLANRFNDTQVPEGPGGVDQYFEFLGEHVMAHASHTGVATCLAHMTPPTPHFMPSLARLVAALNQNLVRADASKSFTPYERETLGRLHRLVYQRDDDFYASHTQSRQSTLGMITSGGTLANLAALWCARSACLPPGLPAAGVDQEGLRAALASSGDREAVILGSASMHYSFAKAARILGLGEHNLIRIPVDRRDHIQLPALREKVAECQAARKRIVAIVGVAGTTDTGAVDPLDALADIAEEAGVHFHVDAAWGGPLLFSRRHRQRLQGIVRADSVTLDGHKQLYLPTGTGVLLLADPRLADGIAQEAPYILRPGSWDLGRHSIEGSRPASVLFLHAALHLIGRSGFEFLIDEGMQRARQGAAAVRARPELELLLEPELNILLYRFIPEPLRDRVRRQRLGPADNRLINHLNQELHRLQRSHGLALVSRTTTLATAYPVPVVALRAVFANPLTTERHIDEVLDDQITLGSSLRVGLDQLGRRQT
jgi:putative pyridoxal-dependent aspartate 1-decarboxylase